MGQYRSAAVESLGGPQLVQYAWRSMGMNPETGAADNLMVETPYWPLTQEQFEILRALPHTEFIACIQGDILTVDGVAVRAMTRRVELV